MKIAGLRRQGLGLIGAMSTLLFLCPASSFGQVLYGSIVGNVTDASQAPVPGAIVKVTNKRPDGFDRL